MKKSALFMFAILAMVSFSFAADATKPAEENAAQKADAAVEAPAAQVAEAAPQVAARVAPKATRPLTRAEIRAMPILERPNRPGHIYGNTVRRIYGRH